MSNEQTINQNKTGRRYLLKRSHVVDKVNLRIDYQKELNPQQLSAVRNTEGPQLVIAGAGSGKTKTLVYRLVYLVEHGINPENILLLTFTRKSAEEMLFRASQLLDQRCKQVQGGTFHSFANQILRKYAKFINYPNNFTIVDRADAEDIINLVRTELNLDSRERRFPKKGTILSIFSKSINTGRDFLSIVEEDNPQFIEDLNDLSCLFRGYQDYKATNAIMDYDDLLVKFKELLALNNEVCSQLSSKYRYIMIDEFQDTNQIQAEISYLLASQHKNLMVVGDDAQSIYSFRGAHFRNIMDFPKTFTNCVITPLEQNYRSTTPILDFTNAIIQSAKEKYQKLLFSEITGEQKPVYIRAPSIDEQSEFIAQRILELREEGVPLGEIAVLFRSGWHSNELEVELKARNIPFAKYGGLKFVEAAHVKDIIAFLRVIYNPKDAIAWYRLLLLFEGLGPKSAQRLVFKIVNEQHGVAGLLSEEFKKNKFAPQLKELSRVISEITIHNLSPSELLAQVLKVYTPHFQRTYDDYKKRLDDFNSLIRIAERYQNVEQFLSDISLDPPERSQVGTTPETLEDEKLVLSTIHSAKGLEWHTVFLINLIDGYLPSAQSLQGLGEIEEERRLLYVACTRAQKNLYMITPEINRSRGFAYFSSDFAFSLPSRFLSDIKDFDMLTESWSLDQSIAYSADEDF